MTGCLEKSSGGGRSRWHPNWLRIGHAVCASSLPLCSPFTTTSQQPASQQGEAKEKKKVNTKEASGLVDPLPSPWHQKGPFFSVFSSSFFLFPFFSSLSFLLLLRQLSLSIGGFPSSSMIYINVYPPRP